MGVYDELQEQGYELDNEHGNEKKRTELWVNQRTLRAVRIECFELKEED